MKKTVKFRGHKDCVKPSITFVDGLKRMKPYPIVRWLDTGFGGNLRPGSIEWEKTSTRMKCASMLIPLSGLGNEPVLIGDMYRYDDYNTLTSFGLIVDTNLTPLFRAYTEDCMTNTRGERLSSTVKKGKIYSLHTNYSKMFCTNKYNQIVSMLQKHCKSQKPHPELTIGDGRNPIVYKGILINSVVRQDARHKELYSYVIEAIKLFDLPVYEYDNDKILLPYRY